MRTTTGFKRIGRPRQNVHGPSKRAFARHYVEMVAAMLVGMMILDPVRSLAADALGWSSVFRHTEPLALAMATEMAVAMVGWMRYRGHSWAPTIEMALGMYVPFVILFIPLWLGAASSGVVMTGGHMLMLLAMAIIMLRRPDEYGRPHRRRAEPAASLEAA